jgi:hypothetical protein
MAKSMPAISGCSGCSGCAFLAMAQLRFANRQSLAEPIERNNNKSNSIASSY